METHTKTTCNLSPNDFIVVDIYVVCYNILALPHFGNYNNHPITRGKNVNKEFIMFNKVHFQIVFIQCLCKNTNHH